MGQEQQHENGDKTTRTTQAATATSTAKALPSYVKTTSKNVRQQKQKFIQPIGKDDQLVHRLLQPADNTGYTIIYMSLLHGTLRSEFGCIIDICFSAHSIVGTLIQKSYQTELHEQ